MKKTLLIIFLLVVLLGIGLFGKAAYDYDKGLQPTGGDQTAVIKVEKGDSSADVGDKLENADLLSRRQSYDLYIRITGAGSKLKQGSYIFSGQDDVHKIVKDMVDGNIATKKITILPGQHLGEIRDSLVSSDDYSAADVDAAFANVPADLAFTQNDGLRLEGLVAPDTYTLDYDANASDAIEQAVQHLESQITREILDGFKAQNLSAQQAVILASIIQEEAADSENQRKIAGVFLNRLERGISLGADPTFRYASYLKGIDDDIDVVSPYNTRIYSGLPPGPIANFNISALKAVSDPIKTDDLYFVAGDDGTIYYNSTLEDHIRDAEAHCQELCEI